MTTPADESDIKHLEDVLDIINPIQGTWVKAYKGYKSKGNDDLLSGKPLKNHLMKKATKNKKLSPTEIRFNKLVCKVRYKVERTFGSINKWFRSGIARYIGIDKMHTQHLMEAIAYNLYRSRGIDNYVQL